MQQPQQHLLRQLITLSTAIELLSKEGERAMSLARRRFPAEVQLESITQRHAIQWSPSTYEAMRLWTRYATGGYDEEYAFSQLLLIRLASELRHPITFSRSTHVNEQYEWNSRQYHDTLIAPPGVSKVDYIVRFGRVFNHAGVFCWRSDMLEFCERELGTEKRDE